MRLLWPIAGAALLASGGEGCDPLNNPYPGAEEGRPIYYSSFPEDPKDFDPAVSYNSNEYEFIRQIYEPPLQYEYLTRPYTLEPLTLTAMPEATSYDAAGREIPADVSNADAARVVYTCRLKPGILFQDHPCFAVNAQGKPLYLPVDPALAQRMTSPEDFPVKGTRELTADDYVYAVKRLANPMIHCPIRETLAKYLAGMREYTEALEKDLAAERTRRKAAAGAAYNQELDEKQNPLLLDLDKHPFPGIERIDRHAFRLVLTKRYPQILYWLAMPFFAPVPPEAERFYAQPALMRENISLHRFPVGTGPFFLSRFDSNRLIVLSRNPHFRHEPYPSKGMPEDGRAGLLTNAGHPLPFIEKAVYSLEKEPTPIWNKFLQGYYDASSIHADNFERAVAVTPQGALDLTPELAAKEIRLYQEVETSIRYFAFNMRDPVVGGLDESRCKLRQAIGIALNTEERIQIFQNGRGIPAMGVIPPGIFGYEEGKEAINPFAYAWDEETEAPRRRSVEEAKRLLAEAGYPGGIGSDNRQLRINFDNSWNRPDLQPELQWIQRQLARLGIHLEIQTTDYNPFQEKVHNGTHQMIPWGWNADYPDPENFLFLFYGPNARSGKGGENSANYANPVFDELFLKAENMPNGPERMDLIRRMQSILHHDAPWVGHYYPVAFDLYHAWQKNLKPNEIAGNTLKYKKIDVDLRRACRRRWNQPRWRIIAGGLAVGALAATWAITSAVRRRRKEADAC